MKWTVEISEFDIIFKARTSIKGQALTNFFAKFANILEMKKVMKLVELPPRHTWNQFVDGSSEEKD